ncbi:hypothetical protein Aduo_012546 [Ancylostoma duodenale]
MLEPFTALAIPLERRHCSLHYSETSNTAFLSSILVPAHFCYILSSIFLSLVRFIQIVYPEYAGMLFDSSRGKCWLLLVPAVFIPYFGLLLSPLTMCAYDVSDYSWDYNLDMPISYFMEHFEQYAELTMIAASCALYISIFFVLWKMSRNADNNTYRTERRLMFQTLLVTAYVTLFNVLKHNMWWINSGGLERVYALRIDFNYMWLLNTAVFPLSFLASNRTMQKRLKESIPLCLAFKQKQTSSTLTILPSQHQRREEMQIQTTHSLVTTTLGTPGT